MRWKNTRQTYENKKQRMKKFSTKKKPTLYVLFEYFWQQFFFFLGNKIKTIKTKQTSIIQSNHQSFSHSVDGVIFWEWNKREIQNILLKSFSVHSTNWWRTNKWWRHSLFEIYNHSVLNRKKRQRNRRRNNNNNKNHRCYYQGNPKKKKITVDVDICF